MQAQGATEMVLPPTLLATRSRRGVGPKLSADVLGLSSCRHVATPIEAPNQAPVQSRGLATGSNLGGRPRKRCKQPQQGFQQGHPKYGPSAETREALATFKARAEAAPVLRDVTSAYSNALDKMKQLEVSFLLPFSSDPTAFKSRL